jgi:alpha-glucoside transport system substrate-binding protein
MPRLPKRGPRSTIFSWLIIGGLAGAVVGSLPYPDAPIGHLTASGAQPGSALGGTVTVLGVWGGSELASFFAMVKPFEHRTGIKVEFEGTRDINAVLTIRVRGGNPPDIAGLPGPSHLAEFARAGKLLSLNGIVDLKAMNQQYAREWIELATVDGRLYGIFIKAAVKGLIWYNPKALRAGGYTIPKTWDELMALTDRIAQQGRTPWCIGLESGAASGWPATDWIENIMLRTAGPTRYAQWYRHQIAWTDPAVKRAWTLFGKIAANPRYVHGGIQGELATNFGESPFPLFTDPPRCYLHHQASFIEDFILKQDPGLRPVEGVNFFLFPRIDPGIPAAIEVAGDVFGMFRDTPQARALIGYLATPEAQTIWVKRGGALSPNRRVAPREYPDPLARQVAQLLTTAEQVRFDASDMMPQAVNSAFLQATLDYVQHPDRLDQILARLEQVAVDAGKR